MNDFNIADVVDLLGIERLPRGAKPDGFPIVCPYCGDRRGKCDVKIEKDGREANVFHCFHCDRSGNMLDLYADAMGLSGTDRYKEAYRGIMRDLNLDDPGRPKMKAPEQKPKPKAVVKEKAEQDVLDRTYRAMLSVLPLMEKDKADLRRRGLSWANIADGMFASVPADPDAAARMLVGKGYDLTGVPGFYRGDDGKWKLSVRPDSGYFCPVFQDGKVLGLQIRLREPRDGQKYVWLSSAGKKDGVSSGSPCSSYGDPAAKRVIITEGTLKTYIVHCFMPEWAVIGLPGVSCMNGLPDVLKSHSHKAAYEAFDMDKNLVALCKKDCGEKCGVCEEGGFPEREPSGECRRKAQKAAMIQKSIDKLERIVRSEGLTFNHYLWDHGPGGEWLGNFKGIDDYLAAAREDVNKMRKGVRDGGTSE